MQISVSRRADSKKANEHGWFLVEHTQNIHNFASLISKKVWSPIVWKSGRRHKSTFKSCKYLALDFDEGFTIKEAIDWVNIHGYAAIIGTSKSHQKEKVTPSGKIQKACDRFRLVIPMSVEIEDLDEYELNMEHVMDTLPCDPSCKDGARFFYPCKDVVHKATGKPYDPLSKMEVTKMIEEKRRRLALVVSNNETRKQSGILPSWIYETLKHGVKESESRHQTAYKIGATMENLGYAYEDTVELVMDSNIKDIGLEDVRRAVRNGYERSQRDRKQRHQHS